MLQGGSGGPQAFYGCQCVNGQPLSLPIGMPASAQSGMPFDPIQMMQAAMGMLMQAGIPGQVSRSPTSAPGRAQSPTSASVRCRVIGLHSRLPLPLIGWEGLSLLADAIWHADEPHDAEPDGPDVQLRQWNAAVCRE